AERLAKSKDWLSLHAQRAYGIHRCGAPGREPTRRQRDACQQQRPADERQWIARANAVQERRRQGVPLLAPSVCCFLAPISPVLGDDALFHALADRFAPLRRKCRITHCSRLDNALLAA